jgi:hypothetical protein
MNAISDAELANFLDEALPPEQMARIESLLRESDSLRKRLRVIRDRVDHGVHSIGAIWRRNRLSCPTRSQLGTYLLDSLDPQGHDYIRFHTEVIGCPYCQANLADLRSLQEDLPPTAQARRRRFYQSSVGHLRADR